MSISHWGVFPGCWQSEPYRTFKTHSRAVWQPVDWPTFCRYMYGTDNEP